MSSLDATAEPPPRQTQTTVLSGDLAWVHVSSVLALAARAGLTGYLDVPDGRVLLRDGLVAGAAVAGDVGVDAFVHVVGIERGAFSVTPADVQEEGVWDVSSLMMRCGQVLDDWWRLSSMVLMVRAGADAARDPLLGQLDGTRTVAEVVTSHGGSFVEAVERIADALADGLLSEVEERQTSLAELELPEDLDVCEPEV